MTSNYFQPIYDAVNAEILRAKTKHGNYKFASRHEAYSVILEEFDELWTEINKNTKTFDPVLCKAEAVQCIAMLTRFIDEVL